jgi:predicted  nucleic acid-binding Zn-ribbon protein
LGRQRQALQHLLQQKDHETAQIDSIKTMMINLQKSMNAFELEGRSLREREKDVRRKLDLVKNEKEFFGLKKEQEELISKQEATENAFLTAMQQLEAATVQYDKAVKDAAPWFAEQDKLIAAQQEKIHQMEEQRDYLKTECAARREEAPVEMREQYESLKQNMRDPYVPLSGNHCSVCNTEVPQKDMGTLRRNVLVPCKTCYRMLYLPS